MLSALAEMKRQPSGEKKCCRLFFPYSFSLVFFSEVNQNPSFVCWYGVSCFMGVIFFHFFIAPPAIPLFYTESSRLLNFQLAALIF